MQEDLNWKGHLHLNDVQEWITHVKKCRDQIMCESQVMVKVNIHRKIEIWSVVSTQWEWLLLQWFLVCVAVCPKLCSWFLLAYISQGGERWWCHSLYLHLKSCCLDPKRGWGVAWLPMQHQSWGTATFASWCSSQQKQCLAPENWGSNMKVLWIKQLVNCIQLKGTRAAVPDGLHCFRYDGICSCRKIGVDLIVIHLVKRRGKFLSDPMQHANLWDLWSPKLICLAWHVRCSSAGSGVASIVLLTFFF